MCTYMYFCMSMCFCLYACMSACMYVCVYIRMYVRVCMYVCVYIYLCMYVCMHVCICICMHVCMYMYACMYVCIYMYVCMYVCMYAYVCMCVSTQCRGWLRHCRGVMCLQKYLTWKTRGWTWTHCCFFFQLWTFSQEGYSSTENSVKKDIPVQDIQSNRIFQSKIIHSKRYSSPK